MLAMERGEKEPTATSHQPDLHSVRKPPAKPWRRSETPPQPKVYHVHPRGFRRLVQRLTGAPQATTTTAATRPPMPAPPPLGLSPQSPPQPMALLEQIHGYQSETGSMGFASQSLYSPWCSFPLLSPGTLASLEYSKSSVL